ncbi:MAG TPA: TIGR01777 family oxidoreductase [Acidimicrobiales bacterium]|nr:TIGR01777 family oxidoreductase [Acidimicrobiales bacterium]
MRIAVTGSTGLIGSALATALGDAGHEVVRVVRGDAGPHDVHWDPAAGSIDAARLAGIDAAVHLAGASILRRWTPAGKAAVLDSRVQGTSLLARTLAALDPAPKVLVSGSAIGWYGVRGAEELDESSRPGSGFLADVCRQWEAAAAPAQEAGIRTVFARTGVVQSGHGGALKPQKLVWSLGLGGRLGDGRQYVSWISLDDEVGALVHALTADGLEGPVNLTAPAPATNAEFTRSLGRALHRPTPMVVPAFALRTVLGAELADQMLLGGQRVLPHALEASGYTFRHRDLDSCLADVVHR